MKPTNWYTLSASNRRDREDEYCLEEQIRDVHRQEAQLFDELVRDVPGPFCARAASDWLVANNHVFADITLWRLALHHKSMMREILIRWTPVLSRMLCSIEDEIERIEKLSNPPSWTIVPS